VSADNLLVQGGQQYGCFPFSKGSLVRTWLTDKVSDWLSKLKGVTGNNHYGMLIGNTSGHGSVGFVVFVLLLHRHLFEVDSSYYY
jgi:hypothetical protein